MSRVSPKKDDKKTDSGKADDKNKQPANSTAKTPPTAVPQPNKATAPSVYAERQRLVDAQKLKADTRVHDDTGNKAKDEEEGGIYKNGGPDDESASGCIIS